jgi:tetratricopeptide (TPR) repeat protein
MIVEMLTGHFPFDAMTQDEIERKIQRDNPDLRGVPDEWLDIVKGCLTKDHTRRWTAAKVLLEVEKIGASVTQKPPSRLPPNPQTAKGGTIVAPSVSSGSNKSYWLVAVIIGLISGGGYLWSKNALPFMQTPIVSSDSSKESASKFFESGVKKEKEKNYLGAIADYQEAIKLNPDHDEAYKNLGNLQYSLGDKKSAIISFKELAKIYQKQGKSKEDIEKLLVVVKMFEMEVQK